MMRNSYMKRTFSSRMKSKTKVLAKKQAESAKNPTKQMSEVPFIHQANLSRIAKFETDEKESDNLSRNPLMHTPKSIPKSPWLPRPKKQPVLNLSYAPNGILSRYSNHQKSMENIRNRTPRVNTNMKDECIEDVYLIPTNSIL